MERSLTAVRMLSAKELAAILGSRAMAYRVLNRADFPTVCIGGRKLVREDSFLRWLDGMENKLDTL